MNYEFGDLRTEGQTEVKNKDTKAENTCGNENFYMRRVWNENLYMRRVNIHVDINKVVLKNKHNEKNEKHI